MTTRYPYTEADVDAAFATLAATLFDKTRDADGPHASPSPKILIVAGAQGSGKTYLLDNRLLPGGRYKHYVRLYLPAFRELHPHYAQMREQGVLHVYEHTEAFIWALGRKVFGHAFGNRYNIIMETALDDPRFADFPPTAVEAGYQFEVHLIACEKEFSHWATLERGVKSVAQDAVERFIPLAAIEQSQGNARAILDAFENACTMIPGSSITLYHRGFETAMESQALCRSHCDAATQLVPQADFDGVPFVQAPPSFASFQILRNADANLPCSYVQYAQVVHAGMTDEAARQRMVQACCSTLERAQALMPAIPLEVFRQLSLYVLKYIHP